MERARHIKSVSSNFTVETWRDSPKASASIESRSHMLADLNVTNGQAKNSLNLDNCFKKDFNFHIYLYWPCYLSFKVHHNSMDPYYLKECVSKYVF